MRVAPELDAQVNKVADRLQITWSPAACSLIYLSANCWSTHMGGDQENGT